MSKADIGAKIGIDGEKEFKDQINKINNSLKTLSTELKATTAEFGNNADSEEALAAQNKVLGDQISKLTDKLELQKQKLAQAREQYDEASPQVQYYTQEVNKTREALAKAENQVEKNNDKLNENTEANEEAAEAEKKHSDVLGKLAGAFAAVVGAASGAAVAIGKEVVSSFGELEQNLGGSEAVFGEYAKTLQKEGEDAYKNLGVSQSEYLATANKMGALFQGSGVDQQRSLELTTEAMQRAADMASVMGISTEDAMSAVSAAAKGNYTMMDNLGVAMNNTALDAYAASKGINKAFSEMDGAEKAELAMQYFFENTSQYAGNFAREATQTVSGSIGLFEAAKDSLIAGLGNGDADIEQLAQNLIDAGLSVFQNVAPVLENLTAALPTVINALLTGIRSVLPQLLPAGLSLIQAIINGILQSLPVLVPVATQIITELAGFLMSPETLGSLITAALTILTELANQLTTALPELIPVAVDAIMTIVDSLISNVDLLVDSSIAIIMALADGLIAALPTLIEKAPVIVSRLVSAIVENAPKLLEAALELIVKLATGLLSNLGKIKDAAWDIVKTIVNGILDLRQKLLNVGRNVVEGIIEGISNSFTWAWNKVKEWFGNVLDRVKDFLGIHSPSTVFAGIGENMAAGIAVGWDKEFGAVARDINGSMASLLPDSTANIGIRETMSGARTLNGIRGAMADSVNAIGSLFGGGNGDLNVQFVVNGREFYRATLADFRLIQAQNPIIVNDF